MERHWITSKESICGFCLRRCIACNGWDALSDGAMGRVLVLSDLFGQGRLGSILRGLRCNYIVLSVRMELD